MAAYGQHDFTSGSIATRTELNALGQGLLGIDRTTGDVGTTNTEINVFSQAVVVMDSRAVQITCAGRYQVHTIGDGIVGTLKRDGSALCSVIKQNATTSTDQVEMFCRTYLDFPGASGTYTYTMTFYNNAGTGAVTILHDPSQMIITDLHGV